MKKIIVVFLVAILFIGSAFSSNFYFSLGDIGQHPDILVGFFPSYVYLGVGYKLPSLIEGNTTDIQFFVGDGYLQRLMWLDEESGENNFDNDVWDKSSALKFNIWANDLSFRFRQGFGKSSVSGGDLFLLTLSTNLKYEKYYGGSEWGPFNITGNLDKVISPDYNGNIYPELVGKDKALLGLELQANLKLDLMKDTLHTNDGFWSRIDIKYGPKIMNSFTSGYADYITLTWNNVGAKTLWELGNSDKSLVSFVLIDRVNGSWTGGESVPSFIQGPVSLGRKVRGFNTYTYATEFTVVNNLDLRITGPGLGIESIAPRINLFFDCGYGWGKVLNTNRSEKNFLSSIGVQIECSFFDMIDLGYEINYLLVDKNKYTQPGRVTTNFTFFLDF